MAFDNFFNLETSIKSWMHRDDQAFETALPDFIRLAESRLQNDLDVRQLDKTGTISVTGGVNYASLPADFNQMRSLTYNDGGIVISLDYVTPEYLFQRWNVTTYTTNPKNYTIIDGNVYFGPAPAADTTLNITYRSTIPALSVSNLTNDVLTAYPEAYLHCCLFYAAQWARDAEMAQAAESLYEQDLDRINAQNWGQMATMTMKQG